jgi:hypothetical protein
METHCKKKILNHDVTNYNNRTMHDGNFERFRKVHPDIHQPCIIWKAARQFPNRTANFTLMGKLLTIHTNQMLNPLLCPHCGMFYKDSVLHYGAVCNYTFGFRDRFHEIVVNRFNVHVSTEVHNASDERLLELMLGAKFEAEFIGPNGHLTFIGLSSVFWRIVGEKVQLMS